MSIKIKLYNQKAESVGEELMSNKVFNVELNHDLLHQALVWQISGERQVLAHTKTRAEVRGGGKKPWRQKGTGRARVGSSRSPIWIGGGVTFGPTKDRNFKKNINKKMRQKAIYMVLSDKVKTENFVLLDKFDIEEFKTKKIDKMVEKFEKVVNTKKEDKRSLLIVNAGADEKLKYSSRNLAGVKVINLNNINLRELLQYRSIVMTLDSKKKLEELSLFDKGQSEVKEEKK